MVRYTLEVERPVELDVEPSRVLDRVPLGELVGLVGTGAGAEDEGVVGKARVDVQVAEPGLALRGRSVGGSGRAGSGRGGVG